MPRGIYVHHSQPEEVRKKISQGNRGKKRTIEQRRHISEGLRSHAVIPPKRTGAHWTEESKQKWSLKQKGQVGHPQPLSAKRRLSECFRGEKGSNWKGGITLLTEAMRHTLEFRLWRAKVLERDNYTCQSCCVRGGILRPHHIKSFAHFPELRFTVSNGVTLCAGCHQKTDNFGGRAIKQNMEVKQGKSLYQVIAERGFLQLPPGKEKT